MIERSESVRPESKITVRSHTYNSSVTQEDRLTPERLREKVPLLRIATSPLYRKRRTRVRPPNRSLKSDCESITNSVSF